MHSLGPRPGCPLASAACMLVAATLLISACAPAAATLAPAPASPTPAPAPSLAVTDTPEPAFPLAGTWSGIVRNGSTTMQAELRMGPTCQIGAVCGTYGLSLPCAGDLMLVAKTNGVYEFQAVHKTTGCSGEGRDFLEPLPDGGLFYFSSGDYGETHGTLSRSEAAGPTSAPAARIPLFDDDDGSPDGTTALMYLLLQPSVDLRGAGISYGEAHPAVYIQHIGRMLDRYGRADIPLGAGIDGSLSGVEGFPEWLRQAAAGFWGWPIPNAQKTYPVQPDADLIISVVKQSPEPVTLFFSGPLTNLALALRKSPEIRGNIRALYFMGGAVYAPGNVHDFYPDSANVYADWNPYSDPQATQEVFDSGIAIYIVPLDATNQVKISKADTAQWRKGGEVANFIASVFEGLMDSTGKPEFYIWDLMASEIMLHPQLCAFEPLHLDVVTASGDHFGQTAPVAGAAPNVNVCLHPDVAAVKRVLSEELAGSQ